MTALVAQVRMVVQAMFEKGVGFEKLSARVDHPKEEVYAALYREAPISENLLWDIILALELDEGTARRLVRRTSCIRIRVPGG